MGLPIFLWKKKNFIHVWCLPSTWFSFRMYKLFNLQSLRFPFYQLGTFKVCVWLGRWFQCIIQTVPNSCGVMLFYKRRAGGCWFEFGRVQMLFFSRLQFHLRNSCMSSDCLWCAWTTDMGCKEKPTLSDILWLLPSFISGNFIIIFFLPLEVIGTVTECLFLYCNPIELCLTYFTCCFWQIVVAARLNLVWFWFAFIFSNKFICDFM